MENKEEFIKKILMWIRCGGERDEAYIVNDFGEEVINFVQLAEDLENYIKTNEL